MKKTIFLVIGVLILLILGYQVFDAYFANHTYYWGTLTDVGMLASTDNWKILFWSIVCAALPVCHLLFFKNKTLKGFSLSLFGGLFLYSVAAAVIKQDILGPGFLIMLVKYAFLFGVIVYFLMGLLASGSWIRKKIFGAHEWNIEQIFLNIGLGLIAFCLINYVLILVHLFYGIVVAALFIAYGVCSWFMKKELNHAKSTLEAIVNEVTWDKVVRSPLFFVYVLLMLFSIMYIYHGFILADIPYPTAWDANHAYMYVPKIWALNSGYYWEQGLASSPQIWFGYIAYWFKFMYIFGSNTWISADNLAVLMNFLSGTFVMTFGLILVKEVISFIQGDNEKNETIFFMIGWVLILLWLTSGMGAFLVFVDNKTDLGIMALTMLAIYSGILFINQLAKNSKHADSMQYVILSGMFFAGAILAKPTATFDVINFTVMLACLWFGGILAIGIFLGVMGVLGKSGVLTVKRFLDTPVINGFLAAGGLVSVIGIVSTWLKKKRQHLRYFLVWAGVIVATLIIVKAPYLVVKQLRIENHFNPTQLVKDIFLSKNTTTAKKQILLASTTSYAQLLAADISTGTISNSDKVTPSSTILKSIEACKAESTGDLYANLKTLPTDIGLNEDVGRYIGYGWRTFSNPWRGSLISEGCHSFLSDARIICENADSIERPTVSGLQMLSAKLPDGKGKELIDAAIASPNTLQASTDLVQSIKAYYQDRTWSKENMQVNIPYIYLVPFNVTFNWSLQNLTSYYTDIGVVWLICLFMIILGFVYSLVKWNKKLFAVTLSAVCAWGIRWIAGGAIIWYSLGVIIRTIIATIVVLYTLGQGNNPVQKRLFMSIMILLAFIGVYQLFLNFIRISSQGGSGPFVRYRANVGNVTQFDNNLQQKSLQEIGYNDKDVFDLQFGYYNPIINILDKRKDEQGVIIAGTYLPYFLHNQHGIKSDGFLIDLRKNVSDNDPCKTYLRLADQKTQYIVIDPNIASVVMGGGNSTLRDRIFAKMDATQHHVVEEGSMTMIAKMISNGYMSLASTNMINARYAFTLSYDQLKAVYPSMSDDENLFRTKLATLRFWPEAQQLFSALGTIFTQRMSRGEAIGDIASILGKSVDESKIQALATSILTQKKLVADAIANLNADEKMVLVQYLSLYNMMKTNNQQYQQVVGSFLQQSVLGNGQIILFKLN